MAGVKCPARFRQVTHTVKLKSAREKDHSEQKEIDEAQEAEIKLVFEDLKAVEATIRTFLLCKNFWQMGSTTNIRAD